MFIEDKKEDTSEKQSDSPDKEQDDADDSSDDSSKDSDAEEDGEDEEDEEDISRKYFTDPASLPKEVRGAFKKMQGVYTRKMQELSLGVKKAQAFDQLVQDPAFRQWMENRRKGVMSKSRNTSVDTEEDDSDDDDTPITRKAFRAEMAKALSPVMQGRQDDEMREQAKQFKKDNPDWEIYKPEILDAIERHPTLSYQEAYDFVSGRDNKKSTVEAKKRANISKPNRTAGREAEKKGKMTIHSAFELAKKNLGIK